MFVAQPTHFPYKAMNLTVVIAPPMVAIVKRHDRLFR